MHSLPTVLKSGSLSVDGEYVSQNPTAVAVQMWGGKLTLKNVGISAGGLLNCRGGKSVRLVNVWSDGAPAGGGVYFVITSTGPLESFVWDNSGCRKWITNGAEAGLRLMQCRHARVICVKFRCRKWKDPKTGKTDWWKEIVQSRSDGPDVENGVGRHVYELCTIVGPISLGRQKDKSGEGQRIGCVVLDGCRMTHMPRRTGGVRQIILKDCIRIDESGNVIGKWKNQTIAG